MQSLQPRQGAQSPKAAEESPAIPKRRSSAFMSIAQAARALEVSPATVRRAFELGELPGIKFRTTYRIQRAFVEAVLARVAAGEQVRVEEFASTWPAEGAIA